MKPKPTYQELEKELKFLKERAKSQMLLDVAGVMFVALDTNGIVTLVNKKACEIFGYEEKEMLGRNWFENFLPKRIKNKILSVSKKIFSGVIEIAEYYENPILTKNGEERLIYWHNALIRDENGNITGLLSSGEDITERKKTEEQFRLIAENTSDNIAITSFDLKAKYLYVSPSVKPVLGYEPEDLLGKSFFSFIHPDDKKKLLPLLKTKINLIAKKILRIDGPKINERLDFRFKNKAGKWRYMQSTINLIGRNLIAVTRDITEHKKAEEALKESEEKFRTLVENMPDFVFVIDSELRVIAINRAAKEMIGDKTENIIGKQVSGLFSSQISEEYEKELRNVIETSEPLVTDSILQIRNSKLFINTRLNPILGETGKVIAVIGVSRDITERKKMELELVRLSDTFSMSIDSIVISDLDGKITDVNEATLKMYNTDDKADLIGKNSFDFIAPEDNEKAVASMKEVMENGYIKNQEFYIVINDDKKIPVEMSTSIMKGVNGEPIGFIGVSRNITERKRAETELKESEEHLRDLNATKDKFFSIIAHDLKSPFNSILGFSDVLMTNFDKFDVSKQKKFIGIIHQGAKNTYKLLENLLLWSHAQSGIVDYKPEKENLYLLSNKTIILLSQLLADKSINLINEIPQDICVKADENMLLTILRNLLSNAIKFTPKEGEIVISACAITDETNQNYTEISVKDNGVGISPEIQSGLFKIAENISTEGTEKEQGTGLGLILCKEFVEKHGGKIWVKSKVGNGSEFKFTIPLV
ncbi:MAG: PAS domain S-box protein [Bacteroidales bacterium]|nr:PAS domain S-box protein [Bacteroidales bacterium]